MVTLALALLTSVAYADKSPVFQTSAGAIRGYDTVAYHTEGKPVKGKAAHTFEWNGATWRFASAKNRDLFKASPEKYAPQFGGYCAYAVSRGYTASTDPDAWTIVDGKLYLNYSISVMRTWRKDPAKYIARANKNWPNVLAD
ncbi:MAG: YHS domain-containing (seleno)protein [Myxococcota bacterium]